MSELMSLDQIKPVNPPESSRHEGKVMPLNAIRQATPPEAPPSKPPAQGSGIADYENPMLGSAQFTVPDIEAHRKNYLGDASFDEEDNVWWKNKEGVPQPTHTNKHVVLKDPEDDKYKVFSRSEETDVGPIKGRVLGFGRMLGLGMAGGSMPMRGPANVAGQTLRAQEAVKEATGVNVPVPRTAVTESALRGTLARGVSHVPGASGPMTRSAEEMGTRLGQAVEATSELPTGVKTTAETAGESARRGVEKYVAPEAKGGILSKNVGEAYSKIDSLMPTAATHDLKNTRDIAQKVLNEWEAMKLEGWPKALDEVKNAMTDPSGVSYSALKNLRSMVGREIDAASGEHLSGLKRIYKGLSEDMEGMIQTHAGARGMQLWGRAKEYARLAAERTEKLNAMLGTKSDEAIFGRIHSMAGDTTTANAKLLGTVKKAVSTDEWNEITSGVIGRLGKVRSGDIESFDPTKFARDYGKLSDRGKDILFGVSGDVRKSLDNISKIVERWPAAKELAHPSGEVSHVVTALGVLHKPMEALATVFGINRLSNMLSRPNSSRYASQWFEKAEQLRLNPTPGTIVTFNNASKLLADEAVRDEVGDKAAKAKEIIKELYVKYNPINSLLGRK